MMKSFFKKLAFVMALAMVVSTMAPAATAKAAEKLDICLQDAAYTDVLETYEFTVGDEAKDFKFAGAPNDWKKYTWTWTSDNEAVATVDAKSGLVTPVAAGEAVVTVKGGDCEGSIKIKVVEPVTVEPIVATQLTENKIRLTFADTTVKAAALADALDLFYTYDGFEIEVQLINTITDVQNMPGVVDVTVYGELEDGVRYVFKYGEDSAECYAQIGDVAKVVVSVVSGKYVGEDIELGVKYYNAADIDITTVVEAGNGYVTYEAKEAANNEYWLSDNDLYFTTEATAIVKAIYHGFDSQNNELTPVVSEPIGVTATNKPAFTLNFNAAAEWTIANSVNDDSWKTPNHKIAVGDDNQNLTLFVKVKEHYTGTPVVFPGTVDGTYYFKSTTPSVLYVTESGYLMPNKSGEATVLLYFKANTENAKDKLIAAINVFVDVERYIKSATLDKTNATVSTVAGYNTTSFVITLTDNLGAPVAGASVAVKDTTKTSYGKVADFSVTTGNDGKATISVAFNDTMVADAGALTHSFEAKTANGKTATFTVLVKDPKGTAGAYENLTYALNLNNTEKIKVENANPVQLIASLAVLSNGAAVGNQTLTNVKPADANKESATVGEYYYTVTLNGTDISDKTSLTASNTAITINLTSEKAEAAVGGAKVIDYTAGAGNYVITVYKAMAKATEPNKVAYFAKVKDAYRTITVDQPKVVLAGEKATSVAATTPVEGIVDACWKFKYGTTDIASILTGYEIDVDYNTVTDAKIVFVNDVTIYKEVATGYYVKYTVTIDDYVTLN